VTWPAAGINVIMACACIAVQLTAASQDSSATHSRQAGRQAGSTAHSSMTGKLLNLHLQLLQQQHDRQAPELAFAAIAVLTKLGRGILCKQ